jgi:predicted DCC family thiol-disulfide oxidoreductase YuxK
MVGTHSSHREPYSYRADPSVPSFPDDKPIIVFDAQCVFCSAWAEFVIKHDRRERFRLLTAQSNLGRALYAHFGLHPTEYETNLLIEDGRVWLKSEGSLRMAYGLGFPWSLAAVLTAVPKSWLDKAYDLFARNRYALFGRRDECYLPPAEEQWRFLA